MGRGTGRPGADTDRRGLDTDSQGAVGQEVSTDELARIFVRLQGEGAHNINLVSPTPYLPMIVEACLPIVHNSNGYETVEAIERLRGTVDVYLPDQKYGPEARPDAGNAVGDPLKPRHSAPSLRYSAAPHYFKVASAAITATAAQVGPALFGRQR